MRAARYPTTGPDTGRLRLDVIERPEPGPGEVLVQVAVSGVNPTDWKARVMGGLSPAPWVVPHHDGAGVIVAVGDGVSPKRVGERVWLWQAQWSRALGTAAEYVALPSQQAVQLPDDTPFELGAGLGIPAMTAHYCLFADGSLGPADRVLVQGGAGAVGRAAIELARHAGARVAATVSGPEKGRMAAASGAELVMDYRRDNVVEQVRAWSPGGVDRIIEVDLASNLSVDAEVVAPEGAIMVYSLTEKAVPLPWTLNNSNARIEFMLVYTIPENAKMAAVVGINNALADRALSAATAQRFPLGQTMDAHEAVRGGAVGKVLVDVVQHASSQSHPRRRGAA
jgi:NADPH2:quinone reductase